MSTPQANDTRAALAYVLRIADGSLILGQRLGEWCGHGPVLEEDIAFTNVALDLIGQARLLLTHAGRLEDRGRDEDALAFLREEHEFLNPTLVELPNGDFAQSVLRHLFYAAFAHPYFEALSRSRDATLAAIAAKAVKEMAYHVRHAAEWVIRLGDGTAESRRRTETALAALWPYVQELFEAEQGERQLIEEGIAPDRAACREPWDRVVDQVLREAGLDRPAPGGATPTGGRSGKHVHLREMLAEMQSLARAHPGAQW